MTSVIIQLRTKLILSIHYVVTNYEPRNSNYAKSFPCDAIKISLEKISDYYEIIN